MVQLYHSLLAIAASLAVFADCTELQSQSGRQQQMALESEWENVLAPKVVTYTSPLKRVLTLLRKMKEELEHEAKNEAEQYDKMVCWCETSNKEKTKAIADADAKDTLLTSEIASRSAKFGSLSTQIKELKGEITDLTTAMSKATNIRDKAQKSFMSEEASLTKAIVNIKNAIIVLSKHQSFVQVDATVMMGVQTVLRDLAVKHEMMTDHDSSVRRTTGVRAALITLESSSESERASAHESTRMNRDLLNAMDANVGGNDDTLELKFAEQLLTQNAKASSGTVFLQTSGPKPGYTSGSGAVFGMLKQMKEDFTVALAKAQEDEKKEVSDFDDLAGAKSAQIDASKDKLDDLEDENATNTKALSDAKEDLQMTRDQRKADATFLKNLKSTCQGLDKQFAERSKTRGQEILAVAEALSIMTSDDNVGTLRRSVTLFQVKAKSTDTRRAKAADVLRGGLDGGDDDLLSAWDSRHSSSASGLSNLGGSRTQLAALAITVQLDSFTKVKAAMDKLAAQLKKQQSEEVEFKAKCTKDLSANEKATFKKNNAKDDLEANIKDLKAAMDTLGKEIADGKQQISDTQVEIKKASQNREKENAEFQKVVADQRATQDILKKALAKLEGFYKKKSLLQAKAQAQAQEDDEDFQTPPTQFTKLNKSAAGSPVMAMIQNIIADSAKLEGEATTGEKAAQTNYEKFVKDSNDLIKKLNATVVAKTKANADAKTKSATAKGDLESANGEITSLNQVLTDLHNECDFVLKNFEIRQKARSTEMEAIQSAKGILSGAKSA